MLPSFKPDRITQLPLGRQSRSASLSRRESHCPQLPPPQRDRPPSVESGTSDRLCRPRGNHPTPLRCLPDCGKSNLSIQSDDWAQHCPQRLCEASNLAPRSCGDQFGEALFRINLRLRELLLLIPIKELNLALIRKRISAKGHSARLERDLKEQDEQIQDLIQLAEDWLNLAEFITENQPSYQSLSKPLKAMLRQLGVDFERPASVTDPHS
jgi:hypothetical protein